MSSGWDRNKTWNPQVEELFFKKLERAKYKQESLRVQASLLEFGFPDVCLRLAEHSLAALAAANALTSERLQSTGIGLICQDYIKVLDLLTGISKGQVVPGRNEAMRSYLPQ